VSIPLKPVEIPTERFHRIEELDRGGIGVVEVASDPRLGRKVALKSLLPDLRDDGYALSRFAEEAQVTGQLDHPNVVPIYEFGNDQESPYLAMKLIEGESLWHKIRRLRGAAPTVDQLNQMVQVVRRVCDALAFAHRRRVFHCDLKPGNVMVGSHGQVYLMDWGAARLAVDPPERSGERVHVNSTQGRPSSVEGTPAYMAPEQLRGRSEDIDERTDVYGVGATLFEILTGSPPNTRQSLMGFRSEAAILPPENDLWGQLPPGLCAVVTKALALDPKERFQSIDEVAEALDQFLVGGGWFGTRELAAGETIISEGELGDAAYIIEHGRCQVFKEIDGERTSLRELGPGDVFGETAVLTHSPRTASVVALSAVTLKVVTAESLNRELDRNRWLAAFVRSLANLFREADGRNAGSK
jgi:serine/threonine-protein kinase